MLWWTLIQLKSKDYKKRILAAEKLGDSGNVRAIEPLIAALEDSNKEVRQKAARALVALGWQPMDEKQKAILFVVQQKWDDIISLGAAAVEPLIAALKSYDKAVECSAVKALGKIGEARAVEPLIAALKDSDILVRRAAVDALGQIGDTRAVEPLIAALKDRDEEVQFKVAEALCKISDVRALEQIITALTSHEKRVRLAAADALGRISNARAVEPLIAALKRSDKEVRQKAAEALVKIGDARAVEPLIATLNNSDKEVRQKAAEVLVALGWQPLDERQKAILFIAQQRWDDVISVGALAVEPLIAALNDFDKGVQEMAANALRKIGQPSVEPLVAALERSLSEVQRRAKKILVSILEDTAGNITTDVLRAIVNLQDVKDKMGHHLETVHYAGDHCNPPSVRVVGTRSYVAREGIDYSFVRQLARQELIRRGLKT